jgi:hypothetical protein
MTSVAASVTGATGSASFAAERPLRGPFTRPGAWWTWTYRGPDDDAERR